MNSVLSTARTDVYRAVTEKIVAAIEAGVGMFKLPWHRRRGVTGRPVNAVTTKAYQGVNTVALWAEATTRSFFSEFWATYRQWQSVVAQVRKGETGSLIVFFRRVEPGESAEGAEIEEPGRPRFVAKSSWVFNAEQVDDWEDPDTLDLPLTEAEILEGVENYVRRTGAAVRHAGPLARRPRLIHFPCCEEVEAKCAEERSCCTSRGAALVRPAHR